MRTEIAPQKLKIVNDFLAQKSSGFFSEKGVITLMINLAYFNQFISQIFSIQITWADFSFFCWLSSLLEIANKSVSDYPALQKHREQMLKIPEVSKYYAENKNKRLTFFENNSNGVPTMAIG